jgi:hypothetical protein
MSRLATSFSRGYFRGIMLTLACALGAVSQAQAGDTKFIKMQAVGQLVYQAPCPDSTPENPTVCQTATVTGQVTHIGRISGLFSERVFAATGSYTGTGLITVPSGDTFTTAFRGQVVGADANGNVTFAEWHQIVSGTGRFAEATGSISVMGTAAATGRITIEGTGALTR